MLSKAAARRPEGGHKGGRGSRTSPLSRPPHKRLLPRCSFVFVFNKHQRCNRPCVRFACTGSAPCLLSHCVFSPSHHLTSQVSFLYFDLSYRRSAALLAGSLVVVLWVVVQWMMALWPRRGRIIPPRRAPLLPSMSRLIPSTRYALC